MAIKMPEKVKKFGGSMVKGFIEDMAPDIAQGILIELLKKRKLNVKVATNWVESKFNLWDSLSPAEQKSLKNLASRINKLDWMTVKWGIDAIEKEFPAVASLFLGWKKANTWLSRQVEIIRKHLIKT